MRKQSSTNFYNETRLAENCPLFFALTKLGRRWKPYIIWKLIDKTLRFNEIKNEIPGITERMLILCLKELEKDGLIRRIEYSQVPPKVEYCLTSSGNDLKFLLNGLYSWGENEMKKAGFQEKR